jgi:hypothetical protein
MNRSNTTGKAMKLFLIAIVLLIQIAHNQVNAMGRRNIDDLLKDRRDQGVVGEQKTRRPEAEVKFFKETRSWIVSAKPGASLVTPLVVGDEALFGGVFVNYFQLGYAFKFACLGWRYDIKAYVTDRGEWGHISSPIDLESPDKKTRVHVKLVDVAFSDALTHPLTEEQIQQQRAAQEKLDREYQQSEASGIRVASRYVPPYPDPLGREERILAGKEAIGRLLGRGDGYKLAEDGQIRFSSENISGKEFVKAEADVYAGNLKKKCVVWALNVSGYRLKAVPDERRANTWLCQVLSDASDFVSVEVRAHRILETLRFATGDQNIYPDLRD